jgi:Fungal Zn(2)-Cys(6) binuclear cluster domain/Zinc finger, C2H2 type
MEQGHHASAGKQPPQLRMHPCTLCRREYKSKEALSRHRNSHSQKTKYSCPICDVVFYRKDLLARHSRIHVGPNESDSTPRARQRSAVACIHCRQQKIKCVGGLPCTSCVRGNIRCLQHPNMRRVSVIPVLADGVDDVGAREPHGTYLPMLGEEDISQPSLEVGDSLVASSGNTPGRFLFLH